MNRRSFLLSLAGAGIGFGAAALSPLATAASAKAPANSPAHKALPRLKTAQVGDGVLSLSYHSAGPEEGRPVVLLHDFAYDIHSFAEVIPLLTAQGLHVIVPYMRGHGTTRFNDKATPRSGQAEALGADTLQMIDAIHIPEAVVAGFGQGAVAARAFAKLKPMRCKGIVAVDGVWQPDSELGATAKDRRAHLHNFARKLWLANSPEARFDEAVFSRAAKSFDNPDFVQVLSDASTEAAADVAVPLVALHGSASGIPSAVPSARIIDGAGHNLPLDAPQVFADAIVEMVRSAKWRT
jgi:pimeloyl-ACP methyl ester carboxylesterase